MAAILTTRRDAGATVAFLERLDPDRKHWVLGANMSVVRGVSDWRWETFHGPLRGPLAARWIAARYAEGVEVWLVLGDVNGPVHGRDVPNGAVTGVRFVAVVTHQPRAFEGREAGNPLTIWRDAGGRHVAVWALPERISQTEAVRLSGRIAAECCRDTLRAWAQVHYIPLPGDMRPSGLGGAIVRTPVHGRAPIEYDAPLLIAGPQTSPGLPNLMLAGPQQAASTCDQSVCLGDVVAAPIDWVWRWRLARKKLNLIGGGPGAGKSQYLAWLSSMVTAGGVWPGGEIATGGEGVLWFGSEEDPAEEILPRLQAAGADVRRVRVLRPGWRIVGGVAELDREWQAVGGAALLGLDPINSAVGAGAGTNDKLREAALSPLLAWAARRNVAVLGILHPPKDGGSTPATMFGSFKAYREVARIVLFATRDADENGLLLLDKGNALAPEDKRAHTYSTEGVTLASGIVAPRMVFGGERLNLTAETWIAGKPAMKRVEAGNDELGDEDGEGDGDSEPAEAVTAMCRVFPAGSTMPAVEIKQAMAAHGRFSKWAVEEAAKELGVTREKVGRVSMWTR